MAELNDINKGDVTPKLTDLELTTSAKIGDWEITGVDITKDDRLCLRAAESSTQLVHSNPATNIQMGSGDTVIAHESGGNTQRVIVSGLLGGVFFEDLTTELIDNASDGTIAVHRDWVDDKISAILDRVIENINVNTDRTLATVGIGEVVTSVEVTTSGDYAASGDIIISRGGDIVFSVNMGKGTWIRVVPKVEQALTAEDLIVKFTGLTAGKVNIVTATKTASVPSV